MLSILFLRQDYSYETSLLLGKFAHIRFTQTCRKSLVSPLRHFIIFVLPFVLKSFIHKILPDSKRNNLMPRSLKFCCQKSNSAVSRIVLQDLKLQTVQTVTVGCKKLKVN